MKMKLFGTINQQKKEVDVSRLEDDVNAWLAQHPDIKIIEIRQSSNGGSWANTKIFVTIWYEAAA